MQLAYHWAAREELPNQAHPVTPANRTTLEPYQLARFQDSAFFDAVVEGRMPLTDLLQVRPPAHTPLLARLRKRAALPPTPLLLYNPLEILSQVLRHQPRWPQVHPARTPRFIFHWHVAHLHTKACGGLPC